MAALLQDPVLCYLGLSGLLKLTLARLWERRRPAGAHLVGTVTELHLYPVKSARNISTAELCCTSERGATVGGVSDRHLMVVTGSDHKMLTGRQEPRLLGIIPQVEGSTVYLSASGQDQFILDLAQLNNVRKTVNTDVFGTPTKGVDCGQAVADWLTAYLQRPDDDTTYRLLYSAPDIYKRPQTQDHKEYLRFTKEAKDEDLLAFQDSIGFHLQTEATVDDLSSRSPKPVDVIRFRPNIVIKSTSAPYEEDAWHDVFIGETRFKKIKCADRCVLPTVDPYTCVRDVTNEPQKTLKSYRSLLPGYGPLFGIDLVVQRPGNIKVGDQVWATKTSPPYAPV